MKLFGLRGKKSAPSKMGDRIVLDDDGLPLSGKDLEAELEMRRVATEAMREEIRNASKSARQS